MKNFKKFATKLKGFNNRSLIVSFMAVFIAVVLSFSVLGYNQKLSNNSNLFQATTQDLNLYSFTDKNEYNVKEGENLIYSLLEPKTLSNDGYNSSGTAVTNDVTLSTQDAAYLPTYSELSTIINNATGSSSLIARVTDFALANFCYSNGGAGWYFTRTPQGVGNIKSVEANGNEGGAGVGGSAGGLRVILSISLGAISSNGVEYTLDRNTKSIVFSNIMYPQTKVTGSENVNELDTAYNNGSLKNGMRKTGRVYANYNPSTQELEFETVEYMYNEQYYVRSIVKKQNASNRFSDNSSPADGSYIWIKVEPIVWYIANWDNLPKSINTNGSETDNTIQVLSKDLLFNIGPYNKNTDSSTNNFRSMWQNSTWRAYLNSYDLAEQNNGTNGNSSYKTTTQANFKGNGFIDVIWHSDSPLVTPTQLSNTEPVSLTAYDLIPQVSIANTGNANSYGGSTIDPSTIKTVDYIYCPSTSEISTFSTNIFGVNNNYGASATDYAKANNIGMNSEIYTQYFTRTTYYSSYPTVYYCYNQSNYTYSNNYTSSYTTVGYRPVTQFNLDKVLSLKGALGIEITNLENQNTITIPYLMYPQTKVASGSELETALNTAYNNGTLQNGMVLTGKIFAGYNSTNGSGSSTYDSKEYYFNGNYYTRTYSQRANTNSVNYYYSDNSSPSNGTYIWIKVEPIVWYITNWAKLPSSINPSGDGTATTINVWAQKCLGNLGPFHRTSGYVALWKSSKLRAFLNGYSLVEENNGKSATTNYAYTDIFNDSFSGNGFIDIIWHEEKFTPKEEAYLVYEEETENPALQDSYIVATELENNGFNVSNQTINANLLKTTDYVYVPTREELAEYCTNIFGSNSNNYKTVIPTDYVRANYTYIYSGTYDIYGEGSKYPLYSYATRTAYNYSVIYTYYLNNGTSTSNATDYYYTSLRPAMKLNLETILEMKDELNIEITNLTNKNTITIPNMMYPQTKVAQSGGLETELINAYNNGTLRNGMARTGRVYPKYNTTDGSSTDSNDAVEYFYKGNYYARTYSYRYNSSSNSYERYSDQSYPSNGTYIWIKVEPIVWYITNWANLPSEINPSGDGTATTINVLSKHALCNLGRYCSNTNNPTSLWQNSRARAYLNGYNLNEQNNGTNGNSSYKTTPLTNYKSKGFIDTLWHAYVSADTKLPTVNESLTVVDSVYNAFYDPTVSNSKVATEGETTDIRNLLINSKENRIATPTDYAIASNVYVDYTKHSVYNLTQGSSYYWLRTAKEMGSVYVVGTDGKINELSISTKQNVATRPCLQLNTGQIVSGLVELGIQVNPGNKTITIPSIMYPQTKVTRNSNLEIELNSAYNLGTLQNGMQLTGTSYYGYNVYNLEYYYKDNYYVRVPVQKNTDRMRFSDELNATALVTTGYIWVKVEPVTWIVSNWDKMPEKINPDGDGSATNILAISQYALLNLGDYYKGTQGANTVLWQNSVVRAYLNGYNLAEQNNGDNGNAEYLSPTLANFKGVGFIDTIWHNLQEYTLVDILESKEFNNAIFSSETISTSVLTDDYVYIPNKTEIQSYMQTPGARIATPTDYALANNANLNMDQHSDYNIYQGSTFYWLRSQKSDNILNYVDYSGNFASASPAHSHNASLLALNFNISNLLNSTIQYVLDKENKTITFPNIMYPQTKVASGSALEGNLNLVFATPTLTNNMAKTGKAYAGITTWQAGVQNTVYNYEYFYQGNYYVRTYVDKYNPNYAFSDGDSTTASGSYIWVKVEPIVWNITNWSDLPGTITNGETSGSATTISCLSQYAIVSVGDYYPNTTEMYNCAWQNSVLRAYLNGYDIEEQLNASNGRADFGNLIKPSFKGLGFVDTIWHSYIANLN